MVWPRYRDFDDFQREQIRPELRAGWSLDNIIDPSASDLDFDEDPFERSLVESDGDDELDDGLDDETH
jgi:hypothetical protein